ncbi:prepilin-type N-terminal cleavage/methylation domain-containing protein [bacterium]|nr:prepilin-type N-terminal cleavage/methylation domain-containing protein [bacterium]
MYQLGIEHHRRRGFTALEVTAAVLIILILAAVGMAGVKLIGHRDRVDESARRLVHAFSVARAMAIGNNTTYTVRIDSTHRNFWLDETSVTGETIAAKVIRPELFEQNVIIDKFIYGPITVNFEEVRPVRFFADGSSDDVTIQMRNNFDSASNPANIDTIRVYGPTGQCKLFLNERREPSASAVQLTQKTTVSQKATTSQKTAVTRKTTVTRKSTAR